MNSLSGRPAAGRPAGRIPRYVSIFRPTGRLAESPPAREFIHGLAHGLVHWLPHSVARSTARSLRRVRYGTRAVQQDIGQAWRSPEELRHAERNTGISRL